MAPVEAPPSRPPAADPATWCLLAGTVLVITAVTGIIDLTGLDDTMRRELGLLGTSCVLLTGLTACGLALSTRRAAVLWLSIAASTIGTAAFLVPAVVYWPQILRVWNGGTGFTTTMSLFTASVLVPESLTAVVLNVVLIPVAVASLAAARAATRRLSTQEFEREPATT